MTARDDVPVRTLRRGHVGQLVLDRPRAINALTHEMITTIAATLDAWAADDAVETVLLTGAGDRGLCAGADVTAFWADARVGGTATAAFLADEYRLNATIARYPKPYVAIMDGIVLGGGVGLSAHGSVRVVTERSRVGMPETTIGFLPDVGATWLLSRAPGQTGTHLALTGAPVGAGDAIALGLADHYVPSERLPALVEALAVSDARTAVERLALPVPPSGLLEARSWIDLAYAGDDVRAILERLRASADRPSAGGGEPARAAADAIAAKSPTSLTVTLRALREARGLATLEEALDLEYRLALRLHATPDFVEGIRAQVIDKDRAPRWAPATLAEVDDARVDAFFAPFGEGGLGEGELGLAAGRVAPGGPVSRRP